MADDAQQPPAPKRRKFLRDAVADSLDSAANGQPTPKEELMPPLPRVPPVASTERTNRGEKGWRWADKHGIPPPNPIYNSADTALWPEEAVELFRTMKNTKDARYASRYMRWWFENHEGMPRRVPKIPRSAYSLYFSEQKGVTFQSTGKFDKKKDGKKIGKAWKEMSEEEQRPYVDNIDVLRAQKESNEEWYDSRLEAWRAERRTRLQTEGVELDPEKRQKAGQEPLCECSKCGPIEADDPSYCWAKDSIMCAFWNIFGIDPWDVFGFTEDEYNKKRYNSAGQDLSYQVKSYCWNKAFVSVLKKLSGHCPGERCSECFLNRHPMTGSGIELNHLNTRKDNPELMAFGQAQKLLIDGFVRQLDLGRGDATCPGCHAVLSYDS